MRETFLLLWLHISRCGVLGLVLRDDAVDFVKLYNGIDCVVVWHELLDLLEAVFQILGIGHGFIE